MKRATSWALGSFVVISVAIYEGCHYQREKEKNTVRMIQEAMDLKAEKARKKFEEKTRRIANEVKQREELEAAKRSWRKWW